MSPTLNGSSEIQHFEPSDVIEIRDGIICLFSTWDWLRLFRSTSYTHYPGLTLYPDVLWSRSTLITLKVVNVHHM